MAPSWIIGKKSKTVAELIFNEENNNFDIKIKQNATDEEIKNAENLVTVTHKGLKCPHCGKVTPISVLRHDKKDENGNTIYGLRKWEKSEFEARPDDVFQEQLYCIKYERKFLNNGKEKTERFYRAPNEHDLQNE
jgi:hypothetical protein